MTTKVFLKKIGKILLYVLGTIIIILIGVLIFINTHYGKKIVAHRVQEYLEEKLQTKVSIGSIDYRLPKWLEIKNIYIEDLNKDTLLYGEKLFVDIDMFKLIRGATYIRKIELKNIYTNIARPPNDSLFNFQFIVDAFTGNKPDSLVDKDTTALKLILKNLILNDIRVNFRDEYAGNNFLAKVNHLQADLDTFQPDRLHFNVDQFYTDGVDFFMEVYKKDTTTKGKKSDNKNDLRLVIGDAKLRNIQVSVKNTVNGMFYANNISNLGFSSVNLDVYQQKLLLDKLQLDSSFVKYVPGKNNSKRDTAVNSTTDSSRWYVAANKLLMTNNSFQFDDSLTKPKDGIDFSHLNIKGIYLRADDIIYSPDSIVAGIRDLTLADKSGFTIDTSYADIVYSSKGLSAKNLFIKTPESLIRRSLELKYDDVQQITQSPQNTMLNINLVQSIIGINDLYLIAPALKKSLPQQRFANNSVELNTSIVGSLQNLSIPLFQLIGPSGSVINAKATLHNVANTNNLAYDINIFNSFIVKNDLRKFVQQNSGMAVQLPATINLSAYASGDMSNIKTAVQISDNTNNLLLNSRVNIQQINHPNALKYDVLLNQLRVERNFLYSIIPKKSFPASIRFPEFLLAKGLIRGDMRSIRPDIVIDGSYGKATVKGYVNNFKDKEAAFYDIQLNSSHFQIGKLLKQDSLMGEFSLSTYARGRGFDYKTMESYVNMNIENASFKNYDYKNINLTALFNEGIIKSKGSTNDSSLQLNYDITANVKDTYPSFEVNIAIDTIQLHALNLNKDTISASTIAYINVQYLDPKNFDLYAIVQNSRVTIGTKKYWLDSIMVDAIAAHGSNDIKFHSDAADIDAAGHFEYTKIFPSVLHYINQYVSLEKLPAKDVSPQQLTLEGRLKKNTLLMDCIPGLYYEDIDFKGSYSSEIKDSGLKIDIDIPKLFYKKYNIGNGDINIASSAKGINAVFNTDTLSIGKYSFLNNYIDAKANKDSIAINVKAQDTNQIDRFEMGAFITKKDSAYTISLGKKVLLNYDTWTVADDNSITYTPAGIWAKNFRLNKNDSTEISIASSGNELNSPLDVMIRNFYIEDLTSIISEDTLLASGNMNANFTVGNFKKSIPIFSGNIEISELNILQQPMGTVKFLAEKKADDSVNVDMYISGRGNDVNIKGKYFLDNTDDQKFKADINIQHLTMSTLQAFSKNNLINSAGNINGNISLFGRPAEPQWNGRLNFDSVQFAISKLGTSYSIDNQYILFQYPSIGLNNFSIKDSANNSIRINGGLVSKSLTDYALNFNITARDFTLANTPKTTANQLSGYAGLNANVSVTGSARSPDIEGNLSLSNKTDVTVVLADRNVNKDAAKSVVKFVDLDTLSFSKLTSFDSTNQQKPEAVKFLNYNLNIETTKEAAITLVIDPSTGDELKIQGDAQLNAGVDPGGNIMLAGNYRLDSGYYILHYQFIRRQFNLLSGSTITFSGSPMDAQVNVNAAYTANTSARDLLGNEIGTANASVTNMFNQKIPFQVLLYVKGAINKPEISFDIQLPDNEEIQINNQLRTTVENKLGQLRSDVAGINKQVFSLLLFNRFAGEQVSDFFTPGASSGLSDVAYESVSKFLSSALNQVANDLFKGIDVDLSLNTYNDYATGDAQQRTDFNVAVTKRFLDDRVSVTVGRSFGIEGQDVAAKATQGGAGFMPDMTVNYKLSKDGKYLLRGYRKTQFEVMLDGYVIETGLAFIITLDYDKFRELFNKNIKKEGYY